MIQHTRESPLISSSDGELQMAEILYFTHRHANVWVETTTERRIQERMNIFALCIYNAHETDNFLISCFDRSFLIKTAFLYITWGRKIN